MRPEDVLLWVQIECRGREEMNGFLDKNFSGPVKR